MNDRKKKLLFIDDDPAFLAAQTAFFGARGFEVLTADGSDSALSILRDLLWHAASVGTNDCATFPS